MESARVHVLPRFRRLDPGEIAEKSGPGDLVTVADLETEAALTAWIAAHLPSARVVGEEAAAADPALASGLGSAELAVVIDPVDGTWNFRVGLSVFGLILAVVEGGRTRWGAILDPVIGDRVEAWSDGPARLIGADGATRALSCDRLTDPARMSGFIHTTYAPADRRGALHEAGLRFADMRALRCSAHEYRLIAMGQASFCLSFLLNPWDHLAGCLAVKRAGGVARQLDGTAYGPGTMSAAPLLVASNEEAWQIASGIFRPALGLD